MTTGMRGIVMGASAGGVQALRFILHRLPKDFSAAVIVVLHMGDNGFDDFIADMGKLCALPVEEARDKAVMNGGTVYFAPPNYHLLVEEEGTSSLSLDEKENFSRPSIDVLFETAAETLGSRLMGVILTGASKDGALGALAVKRHGGLLVVEDPRTAEMAMMPTAAIELGHPDFVVKLQDVPEKMIAFAVGEA